MTIFNELIFKEKIYNPEKKKLIYTSLYQRQKNIELQAKISTTFTKKGQ